MTDITALESLARAALERAEQARPGCIICQGFRFQERPSIVPAAGVYECSCGMGKEPLCTVIKYDVPALANAVLELCERLKKTNNELNRERVRLGGCSIAALGYAKEGDGLPGSYAHSASFDDVKRLYAEKERLRLELESRDQKYSSNSEVVRGVSSSG